MKLIGSYRYRINLYYIVLLLVNNYVIFKIAVTDSFTNIR